MSAAAGKVAVVTSTTALGGACPIGGAIVDFGYGGANCSETRRRQRWTVLWPPNKKMTTIAISVAVADLADPNPACAVTGVASSEAASGAWSLPGGLSVSLRADRNGNGNGCAYTIGVACTDASGNVANATTGVFVPHDQR